MKNGPHWLYLFAVVLIILHNITIAITCLFVATAIEGGLEVTQATECVALSVDLSKWEGRALIRERTAGNHPSELPTPYTEYLMETFSVFSM